MRQGLIGILALFLAGCGGAGLGEGDGSPNSSEGIGQESALACRARGFNFVCWYRGCFQEEETSGSLREVKEWGSSWIEIVPTWYQEDLASSEIFEHPEKSSTADDLRYVVSLAREEGFEIVLKPHLDVLNGEWRGQIEPEDLASWQSRYEGFILTFASLAQEMGVEILSLGTELKTRSGDEAFWRALVPKIRSRYSGFLTYSANWDEYENVPFWDLLDFVGIDFYFPLTDRSDASRSDMEEALRPIRDVLKEFSRKEDRPFLFTEIGYRSLDGMNLKPYDFQMEGVIDLEEQADAYAAVLTVFSEEESWLEGIFWWNALPILEGGPNDDGYSPFGKPAEDLLASFWEGVTCSE